MENAFLPPSKPSTRHHTAALQLNTSRLAKALTQKKGEKEIGAGNARPTPAANVPLVSCGFAILLPLQAEPVFGNIKGQILVRRGKRNGAPCRAINTFLLHVIVI